MIYHNYIEKLFGTKLKVCIIRTLYNFKDRAFTLRELSKFSGVTHQGLLKVLDDLNGMNLIKMERIGRSIIVRLNKSSFLIEILKIYDTEKSTISKLTETIKLYLKHKDFNSVALFGSIVKGDENFYSDIDLLIITSNKNLAKKCSENSGLELIKKFGNVLMPYILTKNEFRKSNIRGDILNNYLLICGEKLK